MKHKQILSIFQQYVNGLKYALLHEKFKPTHAY